MSEHIAYSKEIKGDETNYQWPVTFDATYPSGCIGITQDAPEATERVLLTRKQAIELKRFIEASL